MVLVVYASNQESRKNHDHLVKPHLWVLNDQAVGVHHSCHVETIH